MSKAMVCPQCGHADQVEKVSTIYVLGIEKKWRSRNNHPLQAGMETPGQSALLDEMPDNELQALSHKLAPPAGKKEAGIQPIHPDLVVVAFSMVAPVFLYGILTSQPSGLLIVLPLLAGFYALYFWKRKGLVAKFQTQQDARQAAQARVQRGLQRWMNLYYCARDDGVFEPRAASLTPADQIAGYLRKE